MDKQWKAKWICDPRFKGLIPRNLLHRQLETVTLPEHRPDLVNQHMLLRKTFQLGFKPENIFLDITADDYYKLYINGRFAGQGPAPGYFFHYNYNRLNVAQYLRKGDNVMAVHVYYQGLVNRVWNSGDYRQGMIAELFCEGRLCLQTDVSWKCRMAREYVGTEVFGYETQFVEDIDNRLKEASWRELDYDDSGWECVSENPVDDHQLVLQTTSPLEVYDMKPDIVTELAPGHYLIDFGQEITGQLQVAAKGKEGQVVEIRYGEELQDGVVRYPMRCNCNYRDRWTLSGGDDLLEPYDYKAFRYVELLAPENVLVRDSFHAVVRHYPLNESKCLFESSNELLNGIWRICQNGVKFGSQEVFTDCPSREKGQYLGDATVTSQAHLYLSGDLRLYQKALRDFALSARICSGLMAVAPGSFMQEVADFSLQWPLQLLNYHRHSGDSAFLREMEPTAEGIIGYFKKFQRADGLLENVKEKWNLVDWPDNLRDGYDFDLAQPVVGDGCHNVMNAFFIGAVKIVNEIKDILAIPYNDEFPELKAAFIKAFYREDQKLFADSTVSDHCALHSNFLPLFYELAPKDAYQSITALIRRKKLNCGVYNTYFLLKGLARIGEYPLIFDLITGQDDHSWANMLREGATACFEVWGKDQKWNTSLCHPWASAPIAVLIEDIVGLYPAKPGWEAVRFSPRIPAGLDYLKLEFETVKGCFRVVWQNGQARLITPPGVTLESFKEDIG